MKATAIFFSLICSFLICGCSSIGNGISSAEKKVLKDVQLIEIKGDWHIEIRCNSTENSVETVIDSDLRKYISMDCDDDELEISIPKSIQPLVLPVIRIHLQKNFQELSLADNSVCKIVNYNSNNEFVIELDDRAVCSFVNIKAENIKVELAEQAKISFKGKIKNMSAQIEDRAILEISDIENLNLECSGNSVCRVEKCNSADITAENDALVKFKKIENIRQETEDNASVVYPIRIPANIEKLSGKL